ncbi:MAG: hypothetical protein ACKO0M_04660, partial [Cyanobium sp.]
MLLSSLLLIPFAGCLLLLLWPGSAPPQRFRLITITVLSVQLLLRCGWREANGEWVNPSLVTIIKNFDERERFLSCSI